MIQPLLNNNEENNAGDVSTLMKIARDSRPIKERLKVLKNKLQTW